MTKFKAQINFKCQMTKHKRNALPKVNECQKFKFTISFWHLNLGSHLAFACLR
jgi:hypothetical protein